VLFSYKYFEMRDHNIRNQKTGRREFLSVFSAAAAMGLISNNRLKGMVRSGHLPEAGQQGPAIPEISLGPHRISRLICGCNPMQGLSYLGSHTDRHMKEYYTVERTVEILLKCEQAGITAHQSSSRTDYLSPLRDRGSGLKIICLHSDIAKIKEMLEISRPVAMVHHGGVTDRMFAAGNSAIVRDYVRAVKDNGILAGVSTHNPDVLKQISDEGWDVDFFMTCFYFLSSKPGGDVHDSILPVGSYSFRREDPIRMTKVIRQVKQTCLAFKILGGGRLCSSQESVQAAFKFAFENIKPGDGVIVGMFPWSFDEVGANTKYARELGKPSA
jgi:hypothetical protein